MSPTLPAPGPLGSVNNAPQLNFNSHTSKSDYHPVGLHRNEDRFYSAALFLQSKPIIILDKVLNKQATFKLVSIPNAATPAAAVTPPPP